MTGLEMISKSRVGVIYTPDSPHLMAASGCYRWAAELQEKGKWIGDDIPVPDGWPFGLTWWKPAGTPQGNLAIAGAFIAAEIDRMNEAARIKRQATGISS